MSAPVAIDLGTMATVAAAVSRAGAARVLPDRRGRPATPSVVAFDAGRALVGTDVAGAARCVKAAAGDPAWRHEVAGMSLRAEEVAAVILGQLRDDAAATLGRPVADVVLTVPACFDAAARHAVRQAGQVAGLVVRRVVDEPTAAAVAYRRRIRPGRTAVVYALGGGAADVTVLHRDGSALHVLATRGDRDLGGWNWDDALLRLVHERWRSAGGAGLLDGAEGEHGLRAAVETAKRALTAGRQVRLPVGAGTVAVTRAEFELATGTLLGRTRRLAEAALAVAGLAPSDVDTVLLAGGPTRMPMVRRMLADLFGRAPSTASAPDQVAAVGTVLLPTVAVRGIATYGLGALARDATTGACRNVLLIPAGTPLPASGRDVFRPVDPVQRRFVLELTQGDDAAPAAVRRVQQRVVPLPAGAAGPLEVHCSYDEDQSARVEVRHAPTGRLLDAFGVHGGQALTGAEVTAATARVAALRGQHR